MDVEEHRKLAIAAEREYSEALRENAQDEDDAVSLSGELDNLDYIDTVEIEINEHVVFRTAKSEENNRTSDISGKYTVEEPEEIDQYDRKLTHGVPKEVKVDLNIRISDISGKYIVEEPEEIKEETIEEELHEVNLKENEQVKFILEELITTEFDYLNSLHFLLKNFLKPIRKILDQKDYKIASKIYNSLKMIRRFGNLFLEELSAAHLDIELFGDIFYRYKTLFNLYTNLSRVWSSFMAIMEKPKVEKKIKKIEIDLNEAIGFSRYIVKPIQRIAKYELLLNQILKNISNRDVKTFEDIERARIFLHDVLNRCNTIIALQSIKNQRFDEIQSGNFIMRTDLKWKQVYKKKRKMLRPVELFLFEKIVIIALEFDGELLFEDYIMVSNLSRVSHAKSTRFTLEDMKNSQFRRAFRLEAPTEQAKEKCLKSIDDLLWRLLKSLKQRQTESLLLEGTTSS